MSKKSEDLEKQLHAIAWLIGKAKADEIIARLGADAAKAKRGRRSAGPVKPSHKA